MLLKIGRHPIIITVIQELIMRKELGKWLMDIAKYMTTALLLSSAFGDMDNPWITTLVIAAAAATLVIGLFLVKTKKEKEE